MHSLQPILCELTERIWKTVLGLDLHPETTGSRPLSGPCLTGCVQLTGDWEGAVTLSCPMALGRHIAAIVFGLPADLTTASDVRDALGELANMTGGNLKAVLSDQCRLSLPVVAEGSDPAPLVPGTRSLCEAAFECRGHVVRVAVWQRGAPDPAVPAPGGARDQA